MPTWTVFKQLSKDVLLCLYRWTTLGNWFSTLSYHASWYGFNSCKDQPHYDVWAADAVVQQIKKTQIYNENLKITFVINRKFTNTAISRDVGYALSNYDLPILNSTVSQRVTFAETEAEIEAIKNELKEFKVNRKKVAFGTKPSKSVAADAWVDERKALEEKPKIKRLTIDITEDLHRRIKAGYARFKQFLRSSHSLII